MHFISAGDIINNNYTFYNCTEQQVTNHFPYVGKGNSPCRISEGGIEDRVGSSDVRDWTEVAMLCRMVITAADDNRGCCQLCWPSEASSIIPTF